MPKDNKPGFRPPGAEPEPLRQENPMSDHKTDETKGRIKEAAGSLTGDDDLKNEGKVDQASSSVKKKTEDAVDSVKDKLTGKD